MTWQGPFSPGVRLPVAVLLCSLVATLDCAGGEDAGRSGQAALHSTELGQLKEALLSEQGLQRVMVEARDQTEMGQHGKSVLLNEIASQAALEMHGEGSRLYAGALYNLAGSHFAADQHQQALRHYRRAIENWQAVDDTKHWQYVSSVHNMAFSHQSLRQYEQAAVGYMEAEPLWEGLARAEEEGLGREQMQAAQASSQANLAACYQALGRHDQAADVAATVARTRERLLGLDHPDTQVAFQRLAVLHQSLGRGDKALNMYHRVMRSLKTTGPRSQYIGVLQDIARVYLSMGKKKEASAHIDEILEYHRENNSPPSVVAEWTNVIDAVEKAHTQWMRADLEL